MPELASASESSDDDEESDPSHSQNEARPGEDVNCRSTGKQKHLLKAERDALYNLLASSTDGFAF